MCVFATGIQSVVALYNPPSRQAALTTVIIRQKLAKVHLSSFLFFFVTLENLLRHLLSILPSHMKYTQTSQWNSFFISSSIKAILSTRPANLQTPIIITTNQHKMSMTVAHWFTSPFVALPFSDHSLPSQSSQSSHFELQSFHTAFGASSLVLPS